LSVLANQRHERFAQELAKGKTATEAYTLAGYKPHDGNAATLRGNKRILERLAELQAAAATRSGVTVAGITERLLAIAAKGEKAADAPLLAVARAALMDAAKLNGLVIEKREVEHTKRYISDKPLSEDEWRREHVPASLQ